MTRISLVLFQSDSFRCWFSFYVVVVYFVVEFMVTWLWCCGRASRFSRLTLIEDIVSYVVVVVLLLDGD